MFSFRENYIMGPHICLEVFADDLPKSGVTPPTPSLTCDTNIVVTPSTPTLMCDNIVKTGHFGVGTPTWEPRTQYTASVFQLRRLESQHRQLFQWTKDKVKW